MSKPKLICYWCGKEMSKSKVTITVQDRGAAAEGFYELIDLDFCSEQCCRAYKKFRGGFR